ncbi:MAG: hypothetical protein KGQ59_05485 [Bdellovibrionales bacterium]|nr:hypothetical protein [Bdellovibrionales bacterium]
MIKNCTWGLAKVNRLCRAVPVFGLLFIGAVTSWADDNQWPVQFEKHLRPQGNCSSSSDVLKAEDIPVPADMNGPLALAFNERHRENVCRVQNFKKKLLTSPEQFCPGVKYESFMECYTKISEKLSVARFMDVNVSVLMSFIHMEFIQRERKTHQRDPEDLTLRIAESAIVALESLERSVGPEEFWRTTYPKRELSEKDRKFIEESKRIERKAATMFISKAEGFLRDVNSKLKARRADDEKMFRGRCDVLRKRLTPLAEKWGYQLKT